MNFKNPLLLATLMNGIQTQTTSVVITSYTSIANYPTPTGGSSTAAYSTTAAYQTTGAVFSIGSYPTFVYPTISTPTPTSTP
ncbi:hypothetical protein BC833DRAFT_600436 [Globomyces pollinis-pini]|nr:hypothetical protein BC833DRAFT_600436 [Globomyces pollinis-pini]